MDYSFLKDVPGTFPKGERRVEHKRAKLATEKKKDVEARVVAWQRCKGRCENCGKAVKRSGDLLYGAHFHHVLPRSLGGRKDPVYRVVCARCHEKVHGR